MKIEKDRNTFALNQNNSGVQTPYIPISTQLYNKVLDDYLLYNLFKDKSPAQIQYIADFLQEQNPINDDFFKKQKRRKRLKTLDEKQRQHLTDLYIEIINSSKSQNYFDNILIEAQKSSDDRLLREILLWHQIDCNKELDIMAKEIRQRMPLNKIAIRLFIVTLKMSSIIPAYLDLLYVFDDDEEQVHRDLKTGLQQHVIIILILCVFLCFCLSSLYKWLALLLLGGYIFFTMQWAYTWFKPLYKRIKAIKLV